MVTMDQNKWLMVGVAVLVVVLGYMWLTRRSKKDKKSGSGKKEHFTYDQLALNAKNYTFVPKKNCTGCLPNARPDFTSMTCQSGDKNPLAGMSKEQIKNEIDLHYRKPREMLNPKDLLPETDVSGLSFGTDPAEDYANKFVWHRTTHARLKRRNWEGGAAMIRGDLIIDPGEQSWFQHDNDYRDLTPGFIPKQYCGEVDVEDLTYNMHKMH